MARSLWAKLHSELGYPLSGDQLLEVNAAARERLLTEQLVPSALSSSALSESQEQLNGLVVGVVGAGLAGLTAAWYLRHCGVGTVVVWETNDRVGGRVRTDRDLISGKTVEAGAELIGANHPLWFYLAEYFGLPLVEISTEDDYAVGDFWLRIRLGDYDLSDEDKQTVYEELEPVIDAIGAEAANIDPVNPWLSPGAAYFDGLSVQQKLDELLQGTSWFTRELLEFTIANDNCAPLDEQSYLGLLALVSAGRTGDDTEGLRGYWDYTETHRCGGGNDLLADRLYESVGADSVWLSNGVTAIEVRENGGINVTDEQSGVARVDYLVLSAPPIAWPEIESYLPWDPDWYAMSHGPAVKYLNSFTTQFWADSGYAPAALWNWLGSVWEGSDQQPVEPDTEYGLSVYSGGPYVADKSSYSGRLAEIFPGYAPTGERFIDWPNTPGIWTGYSVPAPGEVTSIGQALAEPHGGRLFFAGEHSYVPFFGYMEGALASGARAAREIIRSECPAALE